MHVLFGFLLWGFASNALGNFWVFNDFTNTGEEAYPGYRFFNCDEVNKAVFWAVEDDVSGNKQGVRVEGTDYHSPDTFEANVGHVHFTIYKNRGYGVFDLKDHQHGYCWVINDILYSCSGVAFGNSVFHCNSDYVAADMN